jgi:hypothetical protein
VLKCLKNKLILHIELKFLNQLFEGGGEGGAQNYVLWPRAKKCVNPGLYLPKQYKTVCHYNGDVVCFL